MGSIKIVRWLPHMALLAVSLIFGLNYFIDKSLMPGYLSPLQLIFFRVSITAVLLWLMHAFFVKEKVQKKDLARLAFCGFVGITVNQIAMFVGLNLTTAVDASIIHSTSPILVLIFAALIVHEKVSLTKSIGVILGFCGSIILILHGKEMDFNASGMLGNFLIFLNISAYGLYLVVVKPMMANYHPVTVMKWAFTFGFLFGAPLTIPALSGFNVAHLTISAWMSLGYIIFIVTFLAFLLTAWALKFLEASTTAYYIYLQPLIAAFIAWATGLENLDIIQLAAGILIFTGVYIVNKNKGKTAITDGEMER